MEPTTIAIAGLGLIGGSMALTLRKHTGHILLGIDHDPAVLEAALQKNAIHRVCGEEDWSRIEILILALSPHAAVSFLKECAPKLSQGTLVSDVCGVKQMVVECCGAICRAHGLTFIGGHPMAGRERSGFAYADDTLFQGASYIVTPTQDTPPKAVDRMRQMASELQCGRLTVTSPKRHDRLIAFTSQLPHVLAGAYVRSPSCLRHDGFSAGSYRDVSRVATVDETLWSDLFLCNKQALLEELNGLIDSLSAYREAIETNDRETLSRLIEEGRKRKEKAG